MSTALATPDLTNARELREQADTLERTLFMYVELQRELREQIVELRVQAERIERPALSNQVTEKRRRLDAVRTALKAGADTAPKVAEHSGMSYARVRTLLDELEEHGEVHRYGLKRGTRYVLAAADAPQTPSLVREFGNYETAIRDVAVRLDTFDFPMIRAELPDVSEHTLRRWLAALEGRGVLTSERDGVRKMYAVAQIEGAQTARRREAPPEVEARSMIAPERRRGSVVAGAGKQRGPGKVVSELLREVRQIGGVSVTQTAHSYTFRKDGRVIGSCSRTPGASALAGTRKQLRDAGVMVRP